MKDDLCSDCPPDNYPTDRTRCLSCPRRFPRLDSFTYPPELLPWSEDGEVFVETSDGKMVKIEKPATPKGSGPYSKF